MSWSSTCYSSLSYLKRLPLDQVKIDQSFIRDIPGDPNDAEVVQREAHAQGIHLPHAADDDVHVVQHDCQGYQGYLFSKPLPIEEFEQIATRAHHMRIGAVSAG